MRQALSALVLTVFVCVGSVAAGAGPFLIGQFYSYSQNTWGADPGAGPPASLVVQHFDEISIQPA